MGDKKKHFWNKSNVDERLEYLITISKSLEQEKKLTEFLSEQNEERKKIIEKNNETIRQLNEHIHDGELARDVLKQTSRKWLFGLECHIKVSFYGAGLQFTFTPESYLKNKFPKIEYYVYKNGDGTIDTRAEIDKPENSLLTDIFVNILKQKLTNRTMFIEEKEITVYGVVPSEVDSITTTWQTAYETYRKMLSDIIGEKKSGQEKS